MSQNIPPDESVLNEFVPTVPNSPESGGNSLDDTKGKSTTYDDEGLIGELHPLNRAAKNALNRLAKCKGVFYEHHLKFIRVDLNCFVFSLKSLPQFAPIGWRIGRGRTNLPNLGVDMLLLVSKEEDADIAGIHARFAWVKGGGGFFLIADNMRGKTVTINGEKLSNEQRLIPHGNTIGIGEYYFTLKFPIRTVEQDEQFQTELAAFYRQVLSDSVPLIVPTPYKNEITMGDWIVRHAIAKGTFGHVYAVTHTRTGEAAAAKELWRTKRNSRKVDNEITMAKSLIGIKHVCWCLDICQG